jgi:quinol monooxygenase YgiN
MVTHTTVVRAANGRSEQLGKYLHALQGSIQQMAGCLRFDVEPVLGDTTAWQMHGCWQSNAALQAFFAAPELQQAFDKAIRHDLLARLEC